MDRYMHRGDAPFSEKFWSLIDDTVTGAARSQLSARRLLDVEGPYGIGLKHIAAADRPLAAGQGKAAPEVTASGVIPVVAVQQSFLMAARDIAHFEETGLPLELREAALAAIACAHREDAILFHGDGELGVQGLLKTPGTLSETLKPWDEAGRAADDLVKAMTKLDAAGFHGPYTLALDSARYNMLFRRYPHGDMTELAHIKEMIGTVVKAPALAPGGLLIARGRQYASLVIGQDLITRFSGPQDGHYSFSLFESFALRLQEPSAICVLTAGKQPA